MYNNQFEMCDQRHNIIKHSGDEDEEDLEFLRLAALKSLQNKKEPTLSLLYNNDRISNNFKTHNTSAIGLNTIYSTNRIEQQQYIPTQHQISPNNYSTHNENYFAATNKQRPLYRHPIDGNSSIRTVNQNNLENYGIHGVEKLNINEPYIPHCLATGTTGHATIHSSVNTGWLTESTTIGNVRHGYHPTVSYVNPLQTKPIPIHDSISGGGLSNVQLSPRSLAFVEQNNDILARRKGGNLSPNNYDRSPRRSKSPDYRRVTDSSNYKQHSPNYSVNNSPVYRPTTPIYSSDFYKSTSPRRWSVSPPHNYKKAISRSPTTQSNQQSRQRSPGFNRKRTISRSPQRYSSRSPQLSGPTKQRTRSRSPTIIINSNTKHRSPPILSSSVRRYSRSPPIINERHSRKSRSPKISNNSRQCSPYTSRYPINKNRSPTNHHNKKRSPNNGGHSGAVNDIRQNRIRSPIQSSSINSHVQHQNKNYNKRKSLSPVNQQQQIQRNRSRTPPPAHLSPLRKYPRRSRDRNVGAHITEQEKNHNKRSPVNKKRRGGGGDSNGTLRNRGNNIVRHNMRRSQSPSAGLSNFNNYNNRKRRSRSRNSDKPKRYGDGKDNYYDRRRIDRNGSDYKKRELNCEKYEKDIDDKLNRNINKKNYNENDKSLKSDNKLMEKDTDDNNGNLNLEIIETSNIECGDITSLTPPLRNNEENSNEKTNQHKNIKEKSNNDAYEISNDNNNNGDNKNNASENDDDDDNDEDGIDLFPSDDSESETEGRFKSNSNRNERKTNVPTLSFAKLNASSVPDVIKDLQDVCNSNNNKNSKGGGDHRFDRRRNDRFKKNDNSRHSRNDKRRYNDIRNRKNSRSRSADRKHRDEFIGKNDRRGDIDSDDKRRNIEKSMFKSTFQAIDNNEGNKINSKAERGSSLGKFNSNENNKKRFKDSEDSLENYNFQQQIKSHSLKRSLKTSTPPIVNFDKAADKLDQSENNNIIRSEIPTTMFSNQDRSDATNGKKSIHSRLGAMTNTFKSAKKTSSWTKTASSLTPPLPSFSDKV